MKRDIMIENRTTIIVLSCNSLADGQEILLHSFFTPSKNDLTLLIAVIKNKFARVEGLEPPTDGFGDRYSAN
jgi:hypothetical protein